MLELHFQAAPTKLYTVHHEYASSSLERTPYSNFLCGVKWSPDGACLLTASDDNCLRVYDTPLEAFQQAGYGRGDVTDAAANGEVPNGTTAALSDGLQPAGQRVPVQPPAAEQQQQEVQGDSLQPALRVQEGELLYDYCWYSAMSAADPASCCLATTGRAQPVHLWDALTGELRCSYLAYNELDEVAPAHSLAFSPDGSTLLCGFNKQIRSFRVERPGRNCQTLAAYKKGQEGLPGIVSCMAFNPDCSGMLAAGSYSGGALLLDSSSRSLICLLEGGHSGGLTHLCFSADGNFLYTGARRDPAILCWDVRYCSGVVYSIQRQSAGTNQRMSFDIEPCGRHLATGGEDGVVRVFDLRDGNQAGQFVAAQDTVNGVHFHPFLPLLATASGQRRYYLAPPDDDGGGLAAGIVTEASSDSSSSGDSSDSSSSSSDGESSGPACNVSPVLSPQENVLNIWRCLGQPVRAADDGMDVDVEAEPAAVPAAEGTAADEREVIGMNGAAAAVDEGLEA